MVRKGLPIRQYIFLLTVQTSEALRFVQHFCNHETQLLRQVHTSHAAGRKVLRTSEKQLLEVISSLCFLMGVMVGWFLDISLLP